MYTAVVLVCFVTAPIDMQNCFTYTHAQIFNSYTECSMVIKEFISSDYANKITPNETDKLKVEDYYSINWSNKNI